MRGGRAPFRLFHEGSDGEKEGGPRATGPWGGRGAAALCLSEVGWPGELKIRRGEKVSAKVAFPVYPAGQGENVGKSGDYEVDRKLWEEKQGSYTSRG